MFCTSPDVTAAACCHCVDAGAAVSS